ncbi:MAG: hypothetical protein HZA78_08155 [Candidatus Schekmanbacteria bacterium]|nr:hypothetical protein [Candidatus Schekmanbacteria bacterium]
MTDKQALFAYRLAQAEETLADAGKMLKEGLSPRSVVNRVYYATFYMVKLARKFVDGIKGQLSGL